MEKEYEFKNKLLDEALKIKIIKNQHFYKVIIKGEKSNVEKEEKFENFSSLFNEYLEMAIKNVYLKKKIAILENKK